MSPEEAYWRAVWVRAIQDRVEASVREGFGRNVLGGPPDLDAIAEAARRRGLPVQRVRLEDGCLVLEHVTPRGVG